MKYSTLMVLYKSPDSERCTELFFLLMAFNGFARFLFVLVTRYLFEMMKD